MSWQKIAEDDKKAFQKCYLEKDRKEFPPREEASNLSWELAARQAVWSWQMGMLQKDPELMVVLTPEMESK